MAEMSHAGKGHREAALIGGGDNFRIPDRAAWLDSRGGPCFRGRDQSVRKRKEGVAANHAAFQR